jgi:glutamate-ammonia-ligase adenylyltransferase
VKKTKLTPLDASLRERFIRQACDLSRYVHACLKSKPQWHKSLATNLGRAHGVSEMRAMLARSPLNTPAELNQALRTLRNQVMLRTIVRDLAHLADFHEVVAATTALAEVCIQAALAVIERWAHDEYGKPMGKAHGKVQHLIVVGMGKLGGAELNVSSDIDLIFAYPEEGETRSSRKISNHEFFSWVGQKLIHALSEITQDGFVFRVDMRLRPYGDSGALVGSFDMLEDYYLTQGREWERYAWIKARPVSGAEGQSLMQLLRPFVYRKYLDFGAFDSLRELHRQIREEVLHKELHDNIKLGPGGIREIEFIAQLFQLIRGGRLPVLQTRSTLDTLGVLAQHGFLPGPTVNELTAAYLFLRNLEHRLQYLDDVQTQTLPSDPRDQGVIAKTMGFPSYSAFAAALHRHRSHVTRHFDSVFSSKATNEQRTDNHASLIHDMDHENNIVWLRKKGYRQPQHVWETIQQLRADERYLSLSEASRSRLFNLLPRLIEQAGGQADPDVALQRGLKLLDAISGRTAYLALLMEYPQALEQLVKICGASPWVTDYLCRHPILLDELLDTRVLYSRPDKEQLGEMLHAQLAHAAGDPETQLDTLRHFKHSHTLHLVAQDLAGWLSLETLSDDLSDLADVILEETLHLCWESLGSRHRALAQFSIIGYGKLGGKELGYATDLDIIFLYRDKSPKAAETYARLAQRMNTWLTSHTVAGALYETDLRLRPDGASGLLVSALDAYADYQTHHAWTWEHQALTRARWVAGDPRIGTEFERVRCKVLGKKRDVARLRAAVIAMRDKMHAVHPNTSDLFDLKHDAGGLVDVEFIVQFLVLAHAHAHKGMLANSGNLALLKLAGELGLIPTTRAARVREAYRKFRSLQHALRLEGAEYARVEPETVKDHVAAVRGLWKWVMLQSGR